MIDGQEKKTIVGIVVIQFVILIAGIYQCKVLSDFRSQYALDQKQNIASMQSMREFIQQYENGQKLYQKYIENSQQQREEYNKLQEGFKKQEEEYNKEMGKYQTLTQNVEDRLNKMSKSGSKE